MEIPNGRIDIEALRKQYAETQPLVESRCDPRDEFIVESLFGDTYERLGERDFPKKNGLGSVRLYRGFVSGTEGRGEERIAFLVDTDGDTYKVEPEDIGLDVDFVYYTSSDVRDIWGDGDLSRGLLKLAEFYSLALVPGPGPCSIEATSEEYALEVNRLMEKNSFDSSDPIKSVWYRDIYATVIAEYRQKLQDETTAEQ